MSETNSLYFAFLGDELLLKHEKDGTCTIPFQTDMPVKKALESDIIDVDSGDGKTAKAYNIAPDAEIEAPFELCGLRSSFYQLPLPLYQKAGKCFELLYWDRHHKHCGVCGERLLWSSRISKRCNSCGHEIWPLLSTAVIVLVEKGDQALLVHANNFKRNFYGLVAGFVETGETLEEAVAREVKEETNIEIQDITYFSSQPWPYPCGLMVGFFAKYKEGEIKLQEDELADAGWFSKDNLPTLPEQLSIARKLIEEWIKKPLPSSKGAQT